MLPHGDPICLLCAPLPRSRFEVGAAWLRIEFASGRRFEIAPVESEVKGESFPRLEIEVREVQDFASAPAWPGGPELAWFTPAKLAAVESQSINQDHWALGGSGVALAKYEAALSGGLGLSICHSEASPMTLEINLEPGANNVA